MSILKGNAMLKKEILHMVESIKEQTTVIVASVENAILANDVRSGIVSLNTLEVSLMDNCIQFKYVSNNL